MTTIEDVARWTKRRATVERWKLAHYDYYLAQKRRLAHRPEYLAHRRVAYKLARSKGQPVSLSTNKYLNEFEETDERPDHRIYCEPESATGPPFGDWLGAT